MSKKPRKPKAPLAVEDLVHGEAKRKNIPTVEHQSVMQQHEQAPVQVGSIALRVEGALLDRSLCGSVAGWNLSSRRLWA